VVKTAVAAIAMKAAVAPYTKADRRSTMRCDDPPWNFCEYCVCDWVNR
jgi:hypothetical protein